NQGRQVGDDWLQHSEPGFSCRLSDINCALGLQQLSRIEQILRRREAVAASYTRRLRSNRDLSCFDAEDLNARRSWFTYPVLLNDTSTRKDRDGIWIELRKRGFESGRYFPPSHRQPALRGLASRCGNLFHTNPVSERLLCLPLFNSLSEAEIDFVCSSLADAVSHHTAAANW